MPGDPLFLGHGEPRPRQADNIPYTNPRELRHPRDYRTPPELAAAVNAALLLGMPLLITGDPGSGKSSLADRVAYELELEVLRFVVKSDTEARDLFYRFDTVGRFHAAQIREADVDAARFIGFEALGKAILHAKPREFYRRLGIPDHAVKYPERGQSRSVVLIDEIDKAPRDVPNDILVEIENMEFVIPELSGGKERHGVRVALEDDDDRHIYESQYRPIVIFTSNQEKALPEPFLRRCVFAHLPFPPFRGAAQDAGPSAVTVEDIVAARLGSRYRDHEVDMQRAIRFFRFLRNRPPGLERQPMLSELLDWLRCLGEETLLGALHPKADATARQALVRHTATLLLKRPGDQAQAGNFLARWWEQADG